MKTNFSVIFLLLVTASLAQSKPAPIPSEPPPTQTPADTPATADDGPVIKLENFVVSEQLDRARESIMPSLGASTFTIDRAQIELEPLGDNAPFSQVVLRAPGVAQDSAANGDLHVRGEHANLQYRINNVLLPEGLSGFGLELDPRFVGSMQLITGSLPAQYGFRTAGIVDIKTRSGMFDNGSEAEIYGGSFDTVRTSVERSGAEGKLSYFADASYDHNGLGVENPTPSASALHDATDQFKSFAYLSYVLDDTSRLSVMASASSSDFQVPNTPGLDAGTSPDGAPWLAGTFDSARLDERQNEQNYYGVAAYQKTAGDLHFQIAGYGRFSSAHFRPDPIGDLFFNGVASEVNRRITSAGVQADGSDQVLDDHTLRGGFMLLAENLRSATTTTVFPVDADGDPTGPAFPIEQNGGLHASFLGAYLQDEWKLNPKTTLNYGARFDVYSSSFDHENQLSPRVNLIYQATPATTIHAGYARYFTPPPLEFVSSTTVALFDGTSNASASAQDDPVRAERADYFDAGVTQKLGHGLQVGVDGYYKAAQNQLDDGLFGQSLILSAFNYRQGRVYGVEFSSSYTVGGFSAYANLARSNAQGKDWNSAQFQFDPADLAYVRNHWIFLDHDQRLSGSLGAAYSWKGAHGTTQLDVDAVYGSGLRNDATDSLGNTIPNGGSVPSYYTISTGVERKIKLGAGKTLKARLDVVNLTDQKYELRDGSGVGVNAAQFGMRRGIFGSLGLAF
jgi:outer membrane receptor protein involved in Fe transport